jgi:hypothetical protein
MIQKRLRIIGRDKRPVIRLNLKHGTEHGFIHLETILTNALGKWSTVAP